MIKLSFRKGIAFFLVLILSLSTFLICAYADGNSEGGDTTVKEANGLTVTTTVGASEISAGDYVEITVAISGDVSSVTRIQATFKPDDNWSFSKDGSDSSRAFAEFVCGEAVASDVTTKETETSSTAQITLSNGSFSEGTLFTLKWHAGATMVSGTYTLIPKIVINSVSQDLLPSEIKISVAGINSYVVSLIPDAEEVQPGDTLVVGVIVTGDDFAGGRVTVTFNSNILNYSTCTSKFATSTLGQSGSTVQISFTNESESPGNDGIEIATIYFTVNNDIAADTETEISIADGAYFTTSAQTEETEVSVTSEPITISIVTSSFTYSSYAGDYTLISYIPSGTLSSDEAVFYGGDQMYCLETDSGTQWLYLITGTPDKELIDIKTASSNISKVDRSGDVNGSEVLSIVDAQIAYDIAIGVHSDFTTGATMQMWLNADVNGDGKVASDDSLAIQSLIFDSLSAN